MAEVLGGVSLANYSVDEFVAIARALRVRCSQPLQSASHLASSSPFRACIRSRCGVQIVELVGVRPPRKLHAARAATRAHTPRWHDRRATQSPCAAHAGARVALAAATEIDRKEAAASAVMSGAAHSCDHEQSFHSEEKET